MIQLMAQTGQKEEAAREIERLVSGQPNNSKVLVMAGDLYLAEQPERAASYYERALQNEPTNNRARIQLGASLIRATKYEPALPHLIEAVRQEPGNYTARAHLATAFTGGVRQTACQLRRCDGVQRHAPTIDALQGLHGRGGEPRGFTKNFHNGRSRMRRLGVVRPTGKPSSRFLGFRGVK
jgi:tetratricopeptide (TPR) repeat protein